MILDTVTISTPEVVPDVTPEVRLISAFAGEMTRQQLKEAFGLKDDEHFRKAYLLRALEAGLVEMTIPDKPRSSKQKYRLTDKGTSGADANWRWITCLPGPSGLPKRCHSIYWISGAFLHVE
ncbi:Fic family protein [Desulfocastanea catecholica]